MHVSNWRCKSSHIQSKLRLLTWDLPWLSLLASYGEWHNGTFSKDCWWWNELHKHSDITGSTWKHLLFSLTPGPTTHNDPIAPSIYESTSHHGMAAWPNLPAAPVVALWGCEAWKIWFKAGSTATDSTTLPNLFFELKRSPSLTNSIKQQATSNKDRKTSRPPFFWWMSFILSVVTCLVSWYT